MCIITISYVSGLLLHDIVRQWKPGNHTASLLHGPGSIHPHAVFNYSLFTSNKLAFIYDINGVRRVQWANPVKG